jgi:hypothetical protein
LRYVGLRIESTTSTAIMEVVSHAANVLCTRAPFIQINNGSAGQDYLCTQLAPVLASLFSSCTRDEKHIVLLLLLLYYCTDQGSCMRSTTKFKQAQLRFHLCRDSRAARDRSACNQKIFFPPPLGLGAGRDTTTTGEGLARGWTHYTNLWRIRGRGQ